MSLDVDSLDCTGLRFEWMLNLSGNHSKIRKIGCIFCTLFKMSTFARELARRKVLRMNF